MIKNVQLGNGSHTQCAFTECRVCSLIKNNNYCRSFVVLKTFARYTQRKIRLGFEKFSRVLTTPLTLNKCSGRCIIGIPFFRRKERRNKLPEQRRWIAIIEFRAAPLFFSVMITVMVNCQGESRETSDEVARSLQARCRKDGRVCREVSRSLSGVVRSHHRLGELTDG